MSNQAMTWAFAQCIPSRAKMVLLALANHADHTTGHCYLKIKTLMDESSCSERAVFNFLGALERNGHIERRKKRGDDGRLRANDYWILFDREPREWQHSARSEEENSTDQDDSTDGALCAGGFGHVENAPIQPIPAPPESNPCTTYNEPLDSNHQSPESMEGQAFKLNRPKDFSSTKRAIEQAKLQAAEEARKPKRIPVLVGTDPWLAWCNHGHSPTLIGTVLFDGKPRRGWYFPTLFPPKSTGPPKSVLMSPEDEEELAKKWG